MFALNSKFPFLIASGFALLSACEGSSICDNGACDDLNDAATSSSVDASTAGQPGAGGMSVDASTGMGGMSVDMEDSGVGGAAGEMGSGGALPDSGAGGSTPPNDAGQLLDASADAATDAATLSDAATDGGDAGALEQPCTRDEDCGEDTPRCDVARNRCVECSGDIHCDRPNSICDRNECVQCTEPSHCILEPGRNQCWVAARTCVECTATDQCAEGACHDHQCVPCVVASTTDPNAGCTDPALPRCLDGDPEDLFDNTCVECLEDADCGDGICLDNACIPCNPEDNYGCEAPTDLCRAGDTPDLNACVTCLSNDECLTPEAPHCAEGGDEDGTCGDCVNNDDCTAFDGLPECETSTGECVECYDNSHCPDADASQCGSGNQCTACEVDAHCSHLAGLNVCDDGLCVECTGTKDSPCSQGGTDYVCDSLTRTCATPTANNEVGSRARCDECLSDAHCAGNRVCVETSYGGSSMGYHCLQRGTVCNADSKPYATLRSNVTTIDGETNVSVCSIAESLTTCAAVNQTGASCASGCLGAGAGDSSCSSEGYCTYSCSIDAHCPQAFSCFDNTECRPE